MPIALTIDQRALQAVVAALKVEEDGKLLRTDLNRTLKASLTPAKAAAASAIQAMPVKGTSDGSMRAAIASALAIQVRATGNATGVSLLAPGGKYPRGFKQAPRRFNAPSFRRQVFGNGVWIDQVGDPEWFDGTLKKYAPAFKTAAEEALVLMAERLTARANARGAF